MPRMLQILLGVVLCCAANQAAAEETPLAVREAAESAFKDLKQLRFATEWRDTAVQDVRSLDKAGASLYLAQVRRGPADAGYILIGAGPERTAYPVMYSASEAPVGIFGHVGLPPSASSVELSANVHCVPDVPMIAIPKMRRKPEVSPLACCTAGLSMWIQQRYRIPLLYLPGEDAIKWATRPFDESSPCLLPSPPATADDLREYDQQKAAIVSELYEEVPWPPGVQAQGVKMQRAKDPVLASQKFLQLAQTTLMKDLSRRARWQLMDKDEFVPISGRVVDGLTENSGMVSAAVIQTYLSRATNPEQGLNDFLQSRGIRPSWSYSNVRGITQESVPCVLWGPQDEAVLVTGLSGEAQSRWAAVMIPETVKPEEKSRRDMTLSWLERAKRGDATLPPEARTPQVIERLESDIRENKVQGSRIRDPRTGSPQDFSRGLHMVRLEVFEGWKVLSFKLAPAQSSRSSTAPN